MRTDIRPQPLSGRNHYPAATTIRPQPLGQWIRVSMDSSQQSHIERRPPAALAGLVSSVWIQHVGPDGAPYQHRDVPSGCVDLLCEVGAVPRIAGPRTGPVVETLAPGMTMVGVRLVPGAAWAALGVPPAE